MNKCVNIPTQSFWFKATSAMLKAVSAFGITLGEITAPPTPSANTGALYTKVDKKLYFKNDAGTETELTNTSGGAASPALDNLAAVAVNTDIISDTDSTDSLGSAAIKWLNIFVDNIGATATRVTKGWFTDIESTNEPTVGGVALSALTKTLTNKTFDANGTGNSLSNVDVADLANGTDGELITWDAAGAPATVAVGTAAQVLTSNGAGAAPTFQTAGGGTPTMKASTVFETATKFQSTLTGSGAVAYNISGLNQDIGASAGSVKTIWSIQQSTIGVGSPVFSAAFIINSNPSDFDTYWGLGLPTVAAGGITYTVKHIGFKALRTSSGTITLYATQADGTTENASSLGTFANGARVEMILKVNGTSSVDYYWRLTGGALSAATNLTTNLDTTIEDATFAWTNKNVAIGGTFDIYNASFER